MLTTAHPTVPPTVLSTLPGPLPPQQAGEASSRLRRRGRSFRLILATVLLALPLAASAQFKDLQVLPKNITKDQLKTIMKAQSKAMGKDCDFCHRMPDTVGDTPMKLRAREMMKMVAALNDKKVYPGVEGHITCWTCHRGAVHPEHQPPAAKK